MLRQVLIYKEVRIYFTHFGKALDEESFNSVLKKLQQEAFVRGRDPNAVGSYDFYKYRISYIAEPKQELLFIFVTDLTDAVENIKTQLEICKREFIELFGDVLDSQFDAETFDVFQPTLEKIHKELRPKISLVGFSGVGKTTITHLIRAEEIPMEHVPTITGEIGVIKIGKLSFALWDFAGQEQFSFLWNKFVKGSDAVLLITDSTLENVEKSRFFTELVKQEAPHAHVAVIGNKQDLPGAMPTPEIERMLGGIHAYSMVATDPANRDKMITIIADILEMSAEVSPLLKPLIERDKKMATAEDALMGGDFASAYNLFNEIADLSLELGDDSLSQEFHEKAEKVKVYLSLSGQEVSLPPLEETAPEPPGLFKYVEPPEATTEETQEAPTEEAPPPLKFEVFEPTASVEEGAGEESEEAPVHAPPKVAPLPPKLGVPVFKPAPKLPPKIPPPPPGRAKPAGPPGPPPRMGPAGPLIKPPAFAKPSPPPKAGPLIKPPAFAQPRAAPSEESESSYSDGSAELGTPDAASQKQQLKGTMMDLKIKIANLNKFLLDIEMKNLMGEMPDDDFQQKKDRAESMKSQLETQLADNQQMLDSI